ncbi:MAG TPA: sigma-70 family RNA polymerase sigma factor [Lacipirellulaceae bacterium]|nr:sigma-70 family RNA polymerase sigma factor [Lacipirellulaceae bacterium]
MTRPIDSQTTLFVEMLTSHQRSLYAYISMLLMGDPGAADVLQDTNLDLWARAGDFDFERPFLPWAFGFARQRVMAYRKSRSRSRLVFGEEAINRIEGACAQAAASADARLAALQRCLQKLDAKQAQLIQERYISKSSLRIMAARLGDTAHNIASRLHRIRQRLSRCVQATLATEDR